VNAMKTDRAMWSASRPGRFAPKEDPEPLWNL